MGLGNRKLPNMDHQYDPTPSPRRLRFSLRTVLACIAMTAVALSIAVSIRQFQENRRLKADVKRLKDAVGELDIEPGQEHKLHAVRLEPLEDLTWKWNVYIPRDRKFEIRVSSKLEDTLTKFSGTITELEPGYHLITTALRRNRENRWECVVHKKNSGWSSTTRQGVSDELAKAIEAGFNSASSGVTENRVVEPGKILELLRLRFFPSGVPVPLDATLRPGDGIYVWINEISDN